MVVMPSGRFIILLLYQLLVQNCKLVRLLLLDTSILALYLQVKIS